MNTLVSTTDVTPLTSIERYDSVSATLSQLSALLTSISGQGFENFSLMTDAYQADLLWLASNLASDAKATLSGEVQ
jgi:hypothetical protein